MNVTVCHAVIREKMCASMRSKSSPHQESEHPPTHKKPHTATKLLFTANFIFNPQRPGRAGLRWLSAIFLLVRNPGREHFIIITVHPGRRSWEQNWPLGGPGPSLTPGGAPPAKRDNLARLRRKIKGVLWLERNEGKPSVGS